MQKRYAVDTPGVSLSTAEFQRTTTHQQNALLITSAYVGLTGDCAKSKKKWKRKVPNTTLAIPLAAITFNPHGKKEKN
jgi:hypothetical protein